MAAGETIRLGTRGSALALAQAELVAERLREAEIVEETEIVTIRTSGDEGAPAATAAGEPGGDKARFVREIERALLDGEVQIGVHSAKDLPASLPQGLSLASVPPRERAEDAYVGEAASLADVPEGARVGTSSLRRRAQLLATRPDLELAEVRGNVDTRLRKLAEGEFDGLVLAAAGLRRLGREGEIAFELDPDEMVPAAGQGALALEVREDDALAATTARLANDPKAMAEVTCERAAVAALEASCHTPLGVRASVIGSRIEVRAFCGLPDGSEWLRDQLAEDASYPEKVGLALAERMRSAGAAELLERAERQAGGAA